MLTNIRYGDGENDVAISYYEDNGKMVVSLDISSQEGSVRTKFTEAEARMFSKQLVNFLGEEKIQ